MPRLGSVLVIAWLVTACTAEEEELGSGEAAVQSQNGARLNGTRLNGTRLNGVRLNGTRLNGVRLDGTRLDGVALDGEALVGSVITAFADGVAVPEAQLVGSTWDGVLADGTVLPLRIDSITRGTGSNADVAMYGFSYETTDGWVSLCDAGDGSPPPLALAVPGTWSYEQGVAGGGAYDPTSTSVTLACRGVAIAKCVELGYKPWKGHASRLAACTRALRADYCGNGTPYTVDGTLINLYDSAGIERDTEAWDLEAAWSPNGAVCIKRTNRAVELLSTRPACIAALLDGCAALRSTAILRTELPPR